MASIGRILSWHLPRLALQISKWGRDALILCILTLEQISFYLDDPNVVADSITEVMLQSVELFIPFYAVPIGGKS